MLMTMCICVYVCISMCVYAYLTTYLYVTVSKIPDKSILGGRFILAQGFRRHSPS